MDAVTIAPRFVRFHPSRAPFFFSSSSPRALLYSPRRRNRTLAFSLAVSIPLCPRPSHNCPSFLLSSPLFLSPRDPPCYTPLVLSPSSVHPFLRPGTSRGSGSQVTLKNLADGRKIGDTYIIHCVLALPLLPYRAKRFCAEKPVYLTNCALLYWQNVFHLTVSHNT